MPSFRLTLEYDGRDFEGWQLQPGARRTVQRTLEEAVRRVTGQALRVAAASRTDAGVHAEGQVAALRGEIPLDARTLARALNGVLPRDVAVVAAERAPDGFDPRRDARAKLYRYRLWNGASPSPLRAGRTLRVERPLALAPMRQAAAILRGTHDFASFQAARSGARTTVRSLSRLDVVTLGPGELALFVEGDAFLRHMVRILAGTLLEVGRGRRGPEGLSAVLAARDRRAAGPTAPAHALTLVRVSYGNPLENPRLVRKADLTAGGASGISPRS
jgi:tRNA pseudouridine38-40 synthase